MKKKCKSCGETKNSSEFHKHTATWDGLRSKCKVCYNKETLEYYYKNHEARKAHNRATFNAPSKIKSRRKIWLRYKRTGRLALMKRAYRQREDVKIKERANDTVFKAIKRGRLVRPGKCESCGKRCKPHGHHEDYSKPYDVIWLCRRCHWDRHLEINAERRQAA